MPIPNTAYGIEIARFCNGLLFTGGGDIDPKYYGEEPDGFDKTTLEPERDRIEHEIISLPEFSKKPVLGICRGMQSLAAFQGGRLIQDIPAYQERARARRRANHRQDGPRGSFSHAVRVKERSLLEATMGVGFRMVNSMHHQAVREPPAGWRISALSEDGLIEGMEAPGKTFRVAVQWHPEELFRHSDVDRKLFEALVNSSASLNAGLPQIRPEGRIMRAGT